MATRVSVFVLLEVVNVEHGHWCPTCQLPSAGMITLASQVRGGPMRLSTRLRCFDEERWL